MNVPLVDLTTAQRVYGSLTADQLAAGGDGRDSCQGDSGGPLTVDSARGWLLVGVVSWGAGCGRRGVPGMDANVPFYADWIAQQTGIGAGTTPPPSTTTPPAEPAPQPAVLLDRTITGVHGSFTHMSITVPSGRAVLEVDIAGSSGDADLYVRRGSVSTSTRFDCRPYHHQLHRVLRLRGPGRRHLGRLRRRLQRLLEPAGHGGGPLSRTCPGRTGETAGGLPRAPSS